MQRSIPILFQMSLTYIEPEIEAGILWRIPKKYSESELHQKLANIPTSFHGLSGTQIVEIYRLTVKDFRSFDWTISESEKKKFEWDPEQASNEDLRRVD